MREIRTFSIFSVSLRGIYVTNTSGYTKSPWHRSRCPRSDAHFSTFLRKQHHIHNILQTKELTLQASEASCTVPVVPAHHRGAECRCSPPTPIITTRHPFTHHTKQYLHGLNPGFTDRLEKEKYLRGKRGENPCPVCCRVFSMCARLLSMLGHKGGKTHTSLSVIIFFHVCGTKLLFVLHFFIYEG